MPGKRGQVSNVSVERECSKPHFYSSLLNAHFLRVTDATQKFWKNIVLQDHLLKYSRLSLQPPFPFTTRESCMKMVSFWRLVSAHAGSFPVSNHRLQFWDPQLQCGHSAHVQRMREWKDHRTDGLRGNQSRLSPHSPSMKRKRPQEGDNGKCSMLVNSDTFDPISTMPSIAFPSPGNTYFILGKKYNLG